jgi:hypothetical protein
MPTKGFYSKKAYSHIMDDLSKSYEKLVVNELPITDLKKLNKTSAKEINQKQIKINQTIKYASKEKTTLNEKSLVYDRLTRKTDKYALLKLAALVTILVVVSLFFQPSIFFQNIENKNYVVNLSGREINDVIIQPFEELVAMPKKIGTGEKMSFEKVPPFEKILLPEYFDGLFIVYGQRQLPMIGYISKDSNSMGIFDGNNNIYNGLK